MFFCFYRHIFNPALCPSLLKCAEVWHIIVQVLCGEASRLGKNKTCRRRQRWTGNSCFTGSQFYVFAISNLFFPQNKERAGKSRWAERGEFLPFQVHLVLFFACSHNWHCQQPERSFFKPLQRNRSVLCKNCVSYSRPTRKARGWGAASIILERLFSSERTMILLSQSWSRACLLILRF